MSETWGKARKRPIEVKFRLVIPDSKDKDFETILTREGILKGYVGKDYIIRGVEGEIYPIDIAIFIKTYEVIQPIQNIKQSKGD